MYQKKKFGQFLVVIIWMYYCDDYYWHVYIYVHNPQTLNTKYHCILNNNIHRMQYSPRDHNSGNHSLKPGLGLRLMSRGCTNLKKKKKKGSKNHSTIGGPDCDTNRDHDKLSRNVTIQHQEYPGHKETNNRKEPHGELTDLQTSNSGNKRNLMMDLQEMNTILERDIGSVPMHKKPRNDLPAGVWEEWLWRSNPNEPPTSSCIMNRCQLLGLLVCRYRAARQPACAKIISLIPSRLIIIHNKPTSQMTLREIRDSVSNIVLLWNKKDTITQASAPGLVQFLDACFHRLGELAWVSWECTTNANTNGTNSPISDDIASIERISAASFSVADDQGRPRSREHEQITLTCLRNMIDTFLVLYRLVCWLSQSVHQGEQPHEEKLEVIIQSHHVSASLDQFYRLSMYYDIPPAGRLNYRHNFSGLYNCVSQPAYFHNPDYTRRVQASLKEIQVCLRCVCVLVFSTRVCEFDAQKQTGLHSGRHLHPSISAAAFPRHQGHV